MSRYSGNIVSLNRKQSIRLSRNSSNILTYGIFNSSHCRLRSNLKRSHILGRLSGFNSWDSLQGYIFSMCHCWGSSSWIDRILHTHQGSYSPSSLQLDRSNIVHPFGNNSWLHHILNSYWDSHKLDNLWWNIESIPLSMWGNSSCLHRTSNMRK